MDGKFIAYYRVSTDRQGMNGNGMTAQRKAVEDYLNGGRWKLVGEFTEVESGKRSDRPELEKALMACRKHKAKLVMNRPTAVRDRRAAGAFDRRAFSPSFGSNEACHRAFGSSPLCETRSPHRHRDWPPMLVVTAGD
jgi:hypothetical protein